MIASADHERNPLEEGPGGHRACARELAPLVSTTGPCQDETPTSICHVPAGLSGGMSVAGAIDGMPVDFLIDTGAAVSLLSEPLARRLGVTDAELGQVDPRVQLCGAGGAVLDVIGTAVVQLTIKDTRCLHEIRVVQKLRHPCILGRDVLAQIPCEISSQGGQLVFRTAPSEVSTVQQVAGTTLRLQRLERIPAHTEVIVWAVGVDPLPVGSSWLVEATTHVFGGFGPKVTPATVVTASGRG